MKQWYMLTLVGKDRPGIVAQVTATLFAAGCNLGETSMLRLGSNFTIMLMLEASQSGAELEAELAPLTDSLGLHRHIDAVEGGLHQHLEPDVQITVYGADRAGIVARATEALADAGLNIIDLESKVGGSEAAPVYVMQIEGVATAGVEPLQSALGRIRRDGVEAQLQTVDVLIG